MNVADLEAVYEAVAKAIDAAGPNGSEVFLAKLVLLLAREIGDAERVLALVARAQVGASGDGGSAGT